MKVFDRLDSKIIEGGAKKTGSGLHGRERQKKQGARKKI